MTSSKEYNRKERESFVCSLLMSLLVSLVLLVLSIPSEDAASCNRSVLLLLDASSSARKYQSLILNITDYFVEIFKNKAGNPHLAIETYRAGPSGTLYRPVVRFDSWRDLSIVDVGKLVRDALGGGSGVAGPESKSLTGEFEQMKKEKSSIFILGFEISPDKQLQRFFLESNGQNRAKIYKMSIGERVQFRSADEQLDASESIKSTDFEKLKNFTSNSLRNATCNDPPSPLETAGAAGKPQEWKFGAIGIVICVLVIVVSAAAMFFARRNSKKFLNESL